MHGNGLEASFDGGPLYPTVNAIGKCVLGCGGVRWLGTDTLCRQARGWSAVTAQECPSLALSLWVDVKQLSESPLRCLVSVRIPDDSRL